MTRNVLAVLLLACGLLSASGVLAAQAVKRAPMPFVMQMTTEEGLQQRRAFLQIAKVLEDMGPDKVRIEVVAYEGGILSLLANNEGTATLLADLARKGVKFKACRISMKASDLSESDFPLEVEFVPAGAPEMIRLQTEGYRYWRP
jgi:intracellular sulfur oxidation DsrE/DsrF family protein